MLGNLILLYVWPLLSFLYSCTYVMAFWYRNVWKRRIVELCVLRPTNSYNEYFPNNHMRFVPLVYYVLSIVWEKVPYLMEINQIYNRDKITVISKIEQTRKP